ncbi:MAG: ABC transporter permease [Chloroflexi bacterium]|nr:ABC transporter permease [Chloroflexota bacterium]
MNIVRRSLLNLLRSPVRTILIVVLLVLSVGLALIMLTINGAFQNQLGSISTNLGTEIEIRPAGSFGPMGGGEPLSETDITKLSNLAHVASVQESVQTQYTGSSLESAVDAGSLGNRGQTNGQTTLPGMQAPPGGNFRMGIMVMGIDPSVTNPVLMGNAKLSMSEGSYFTLDQKNSDVIIVGEAIAEKNNLTIGSKIDIEGISVKVIGIYDSGQVFGNNMLVLPISTAQRLFDIDGATSVTVVADDVGNVDAVVTSIRTVFDEDTADVTTAKDQYERIGGSVTSAENTSKIAMIAAFIVAGTIILFSVFLMMRQRVKEIGILKAIGASNWQISFQFTIETLMISIVSAVIGALITYPLARTVANLMVSGTGTTNSRFPGGFRGPNSFAFAGVNVAVSPWVFLYAIIIAVVLALIAGIIPSWYISRVRPAEVLRNE